MINNFTKKSVFLSLPLLILLFSVNYFGDAANIFRLGFEEKAVKIIASDSLVTNLVNYDERLFQKEFVNIQKQSPDIVVIGSSRTMLINSKYFDRKIVRNNSVSGASIEDIIAIYQLYKNKNILPEKIIIGIDPWIFNQNHGQTRWESLSNEYYTFTGAKKAQQGKQFKYSQLWSLSYFQASVKEIIKNYDERPIATLHKYNKTITKLKDGSIVYGNKYRASTEKEINSNLKLFMSGKLYSIENFNKLSSKIICNFEKLINDMRLNGVTIEFFLAPYHPDVYAVISANKKYNMVLSTEKLITEFAHKKGIKLYGSFNPTKHGLTKSNFYDAMHCNEQGMKKLWNYKK